MAHEAERPVTGAGDNGETSLAQELEAIPYEPLLQIEIKLVVWCLVLGVVLLGVLLWASATFFPVAGLAPKG
jgi:hypothetical protein